MNVVDLITADMPDFDVTLSASPVKKKRDALRILNALGYRRNKRNIRLLRIGGSSLLVTIRTFEFGARVGNSFANLRSSQKFSSKQSSGVPSYRASFLY